MDKHELISRIEKFDLSEEQLTAIEKILALEFEFENYETILIDISTELPKAKRKVKNLSDVGIEIGYTVGKYLKNKKEKKDLIDGIKKGISLNLKNSPFNPTSSTASEHQSSVKKPFRYH